MFEYKTCSEDNCKDPAWAGSTFCRKHHPGSESYEKNTIRELMEAVGVLENRDFSGLDLSGINLDRYEFHYCRFTDAVFAGASFRDSQFLMCLLDNVNGVESIFTGCRMMSVLAAGSDFSGCDFSGSDLININFNGIQGAATVFDESDLFYSRFIYAALPGASFQDCNLKRVDFTEADLRNVNFSDSNPEESYIPHPSDNPV